MQYLASEVVGQWLGGGMCVQYLASGVVRQWLGGQSISRHLVPMCKF